MRVETAAHKRPEGLLHIDVETGAANLDRLPQDGPGPDISVAGFAPAEASVSSRWPEDSSATFKLFAASTGSRTVQNLFLGPLALPSCPEVICAKGKDV